jgi:PAS domain S-box-containing protein
MGSTYPVKRKNKPKGRSKIRKRNQRKTKGRAAKAQAKPRRLVGIHAYTTQEREALHTLRESEQKYRSLVEGLPDIVWSFSTKKGTVYASSRVKSILGYTPQYLYEHPWLWNKSIHPEDHARVSKVIVDFMKGKDFAIEYRIKDAKGRWRWFLDRSVGRRKFKDEVIIEGISTEITVRKQIAEQLRLSEARYRGLTYSITDVFFEMDEDLRYTYWNRASEKLTGISARNAIGKAITEIFPESNETRKAVRLYRRVLKSHEPAKFETEYVLNGTKHYFEINAYPSLRGVSVIAEDISLRKKVEKTIMRRDVILAAVSSVAEQFLRIRPRGRVVNNALKSIANAAGVCRAYVFENHLADDGTLLTSERYEWTGPSCKPQIQNPLLHNTTYAKLGFARWPKILSRGEPIHSPVRLLPAVERQTLTAQGVKSIAIMPIFVGGKWWGFTGFNECRYDKDWTNAEIDALKAWAEMISSALQRREIETRIAKHGAEQALITNIARFVGSSLNLPDILERLMHKTMTLGDCEHGAVYLMDRKSRQYTCFVFRGVFGEKMPELGILKFDTQMIRRAIASHHPILMANPQCCPILWRKLTREEGMRTVLLIPLASGNTIQGVLALTAENKKNYDNRELNLFSTIGRYAGHAIEKARLYNSAQRELSERRLLEKELRQSEAKYRTIFDTAPDAILTFDLDGNITSCNKTITDLTGYSVSDLIGHHFSDLALLSTEDIPKFAKILSKPKAVQIPPPFRIRLRTKSGEQRIAEVRSSVLKTGKKINAFQIIARDMTESERAEALLKKRSHDLEERIKESSYLNTLSQHLTAPRISIDEILKRAVDSIRKAYQYPEITCGRIILEKKVFQTINYKDTKWKQTSDILVNGNKVGFIEVGYLKEKPESDEGPFMKEKRSLIGTTSRMLANYIERKQIEQTLEKSEILHKEAQRVAHIGHWELAPDMSIPVWSDEIFRIFGLEPGEGEPSFADHETHLHPDDWPLLNKAITRASKDGTPFDITFRIVRPSGEMRWVHAIGMTTTEKTGKVERLFGTAQDITERTQQELLIKRRDVILEAIAFGAEKFLRARNWTDVIQEVLERLGKAADVSRVYLFRNHRGKNNALLTSVDYEWTRQDTAPQIDNPMLKNVLYRKDGFERWVRIMSRGKHILGHVREFPPEEKETLAYQEIKSILVVPVFVDNKWWGFIGFDECRYEREWSTAAIEALKIAANAIGAAIQRASVLGVVKYQADLLDDVSDAIISTDLDFRIISWNKAAENLYGRKAQDVIGKTVTHVTQLEYPYDNQSNVVKRFFKEGFWNGEVIQKHRNGTAINVFSSVTLIKGNDGKAVGAVAVNRDITEQKKAEAALVKSEMKYRSLVEDTNVGIVSLDKNGAFIYVNRAFCKMLGYKRNELLGGPLAKFLYEEDRGFVVDVFLSKPMKRRHRTPLEFRAMHKNGQTVTMLSNPTYVKERGKTLEIHAVIENISGRKETERVVRHHLKLENRLAKLSEKLVKARDVAPALDEALVDLADLFEVDRAILAERDEKTKNWRITHEWHAHGLSPVKEKVPEIREETFSEWFSRLKKQRYVSVIDTAQLPKSLIDTFGGIVEQPPKSVLAIPLYIERRLSGILWLTSIKQYAKWQKYDIEVLQAAGDVMMASVFKDRYQTRLTRTLKDLDTERQRIVDLAKKTIEMQERERLYFASEIHDNLLQSLVAVLYYLQMIDIPASDKKVKERKDHLVGTIKSSIDSGRAMIREIEPLHTPEISLIEAVKNTLETRFSGTSTKHDFKRPTRTPQMSFAAKVNILRIIQEAAMNVRKHAHANNLKVTIEARKSSLLIDITDDGIGFNLPPLTVHSTDHLGLVTMQERARLLGGELTVKSTPGKGTSVAGVFHLKDLRK